MSHPSPAPEVPMTDQPSTAFLALDFATYIVENFSHDPAVAERASNALTSARAA
jgi:hypothetical protein